MQFVGRGRWMALAVLVLAAFLAPPPSGAVESSAQAVDINRASAAELASLPGIGEAKAQAIIEHRTAEPFEAIDDLKRVPGIGERTFETLRPSITVGGER